MGDGFLVGFGNSNEGGFVQRVTGPLTYDGKPPIRFADVQAPSDISVSEGKINYDCIYRGPGVLEVSCNTDNCPGNCEGYTQRKSDGSQEVVGITVVQAPSERTIQPSKLAREIFGYGLVLEAKK